MIRLSAFESKREEEVEIETGKIQQALDDNVKGGRVANN